MAKNLQYCHSHPIDNIEFAIYKSYTWYAEHLLYLLNIHAQNLFEKKLWVRPDLCLLKHCKVVEWQQTIFPTEKTEYKLFTLDYEAWIVEELLWWKRRKTQNHQFLTHSWTMINWLYMWLLISKEDIEKALLK
jgi:hypothetical protein